MDKIGFHISVTWHWDELSKCWVVHSPLYDITAYGKTEHEAEEMLRLQISEFLLMSKPKPLPQ